MSKNYMIYGTKRCGHHGIIDWLKPQIGEIVRHFNDRRYALMPLEHRDDEHNLVEHLLELREKVYLFDNGIRQRSSEVYLDKYNDVDNIISFEGIELTRMNELGEQWLQDMNRGLKTINPNFSISNDMTHIVVLRNPWNIAASQIRWSLDRPDNYNRVLIDMAVWSDFYDNYINKKEDTHFIVFDKWFMNIEYRKKISSDLGLEFNDINKNNVALAGGGSSFDKMNFDGNAEDMNVLYRYQEMMEHPRMKERFLDTDMASEVKNKWNHLCDLEEIDLKIK